MRRSAWILSTIVLMLSGLTLGGAGTTVATADGALSLSQPIELPHLARHEVGGPSSRTGVVRGEGEPGVKVDSTGTIYVNATCCVGRGAATWRSTDGGKTFPFMTSPAEAREGIIGAEGDFAIDDADRVIFADTGLAAVPVTRWRDHGATWERTVVASELTPVNDRPWLAYGQSALYLYLNAAVYQNVFRSYDEGVTWNPVPISPLFGGLGHLAANRQDGALWVLEGLTSRVSLDDGATWNSGEVSQQSFDGTFPVIATDEAGNGYAAWAGRQGTCNRIFMAASTNHGQSWGPTTKVSGPGCGSLPWIEAGSAGHVVVAWYEQQGTTQRVHAAVSTNATSESPTFTTAIAAGPAEYRLDFLQVAVGPDGRFHVVYEAPGVEQLPQLGEALWTWYTKQTGGPRLHADRIAPATEVSTASATAEAGRLDVTGASTFKKPAKRILFTLAGATGLGGTVERVGPDSDELLLTLHAPPNGTLGYDGLPGNTFDWRFTVNGVQHTLHVDSRTATGPAFTVDGKTIGGTIDGFAGHAIARLSLSSVGATPGSTIVFQAPSSPVFGTGTGTATYAVPKATVELSLQRDGVEVATGPGELSADTTSFAGSLDVSGLEPGEYSLVATACYSGDCASTPRAVELA